VRIKKLRIKGFGSIIDKEFDFDQSFTTLLWEEKGKQETLSDVIVALLFGFPPHRRSSLEKYCPVIGKKQYSASLVVETEAGEFLIGRNFPREILEVFKYEEKRLLPLPATVLMDIIYSEFGTLNPLDFEAISLFQNNNLRLNQYAPLIREHVQQLVYEGVLERVLPRALSLEEANQGQIKERLIKNEDLLKKLTSLQSEVKCLEEQENKLSHYEQFLSVEHNSLLEELSREYTAATLERSFYEEQLREEKESRKIIEREARLLREKIATFDQTLYTNEIQQRVMDMLTIRDHKNVLLQKEEEDLNKLGKKGVFSRMNSKEAEEIKLRIERLLYDLSRIREELRVLLKGKKPEEFLKEKTLLEQYSNDLLRLEYPSIQKENDHENRERLKKIKEHEGSLRQQFDKLLVLAGQEELEIVKTKVKQLQQVKQKKKIVEEEIKELTTEVGMENPDQAMAYLEQKKKSLEEELVTIAEQDTWWGDDELSILYQEASRLLAVFTLGRHKKITPRISGNQLGFIVSGEEGEVLDEQLEADERDLTHLAFRLAMAKRRMVEEKALILMNNYPKLLTAESRENLLSLLKEWFKEGQIILIQSND
jgi:hypothetical protein